MLDHVTVVVGNRAEVEVAVGTRDPQQAADRLLEHGVELALVKHGRRRRAGRHPGRSAPSCRRTRSRWSAASAPATPSAARSCTGCSSGWEPARIAEYANAAGALVASRLACADAMPTAEELDALVASRGAHDDRHRRTRTADRTPTLTDEQWAALLRTRATDPGAVAAAYAARRRPGRLLDDARHPLPGRRRPPGPRRAGLRRRRDGDGRPALAARPPGRGARATPTSTACSAPPTSSRSCCCSARSRTRSSSAR